MFGGLGQLVAALGSRSVDVYEWEQADIRRARLPNGPRWSKLAKMHPRLHFTGWQLAHAVVKADFLVERNLLLPGLGFLFQVDQILDFGSSPDLRTVPGAAVTLNDFTRTSLSGRIGQGLSMLFAHSKGYTFVGHLASDPAVSSHLASLGKPTKVADFLFETKTMERMILESKGSFSQVDNDPTDIKRVLKVALTGQIDYWMSRVTPNASQGYAVYTCLRETGSGTPSALVFVDPAGQDTIGPVELPEDWARRRNYAAWVTFMGFPDTARSLRGTQIRDGVAVDLPVFRIGDRDIAVSSVLGHAPKGKWVGAGLEVRALEAIGAAVSSDDRQLMNYAGDFADGIGSAGLPEANGSIFPDGSWFGEIDGNTPFRGFAAFRL